MLAVIIDLIAAYLIAARVKSWWLKLLLGLLVGWIASIAAELAMYALFPGVFTINEIMRGIVLGLVWHPVVIFVATWIFGRFIARKKSIVEQNRAA